MPDPYIPPATLDKLASPAPVGTRHQTAIELAMPLIGNGATDSAVFALLRGKFEPDFSDKEIEAVIRWVRGKNPSPSSVSGNGNGGYHPPAARLLPPKPPSRTPVEQCEWWTSGARLDPAAMSRTSPVPIPEDFKEQTITALSGLYSDKDTLNIVCAFTQDEGKVRPSGAGRCDTRDGWIGWCKRHSVPKQKAGAWFRINPCHSPGSGEGGAIMDRDVTDFRFALLESDCLPIPVQLALFVRLKLPIAAIVTSGGASAHAWVKVGAVNEEHYTRLVKRLFALLKPFGIDQANCNPSRLSRLPGAHREIGGDGDGMQRLLWLNPNCGALTDKALADFEESLALPAIEEFPLKSLAQSSVNRYEDLYNNRGRLGVPTGIPKLDSVSGGMKKGQTWVVAGETGKGKSTFALHVIDAALRAGYGVLLFSLEMDKEEVFDLIISNRAGINRNKFNNGQFHPSDFETLRDGMAEVSKLALYIEDSAMTSADQIRLRAMQLNAAGKIGLVVVDYAQFINPEWIRDNSREQQVASISHKLRALSRESRLPFLILSQLNDEGKLRESRVLGHNANVVLLVEVDRDKMTIKTVKGRGIPCDEYTLEFARLYARLIPEPLIAPTADDENRNNRNHQSLPYHD